MSQWLRAAIDGGHIILFDFDSFTQSTPIARGAFGEVSRAYWDSAEKVVALKTLYNNPGTEFDQSFEEFIKELRLIRSVDFHDNVIRFFGVTYDYLTIYENAWNSDPSQRSDIEEIRNKLEKVRLIPVWEDPTKQRPQIQNIQMNNNQTRPSSSGGDPNQFGRYVTPPSSGNSGNDQRTNYTNYPQGLPQQQSMYPPNSQQMYPHPNSQQTPPSSLSSSSSTLRPNYPPQNYSNPHKTPISQSSQKSSQTNKTKSKTNIYSKMIPCVDILTKYVDENQNSINYVELNRCNAALHVGAEDVIGLQYHLDHGAAVDSNYEFKGYIEPLVHIASAHCSGKKLITMLKTLKAYHADFSLKSKNGKTALHRLYENNMKKNVPDDPKFKRRVGRIAEAIKLLCENKCLVNARDPDKRTVLSYYLVEKDKQELKQPIITTLLEMGANPNLSITVESTYQTFYAPTALFMAIQYDWPIETIKFMLEKGADARIQDTKKKMNILCLATFKKKPDVMQWLLEHVYCLSEPESIKLAKRYDSTIVSKSSTLLFSWQFDLNKSKRRLTQQQNVENFPPDHKIDEEDLEKPC
ncbi:687_t:CDS:2 [Diversispora eburnea]|uniref:687_t:CDS:1 n=1 Tax=Diversispora eburnea TaxID=1213867 RepID=A0A9N9B7G0_9GLOM|nr:687_t:CDS:2 [Diversispora eburnea]